MSDHACNSQILIIFWTYVIDLYCSVRPSLAYWKVRQVWKLQYGSYSAVLSKWEIFIKMRVAESLPSFDIEQSFINQKVLFLYKNNLLLSEKPSNVPFSMRIHGFMTFLLLHFVSSKGERREKWQQGHKWAAAASALSLKLMQFSLRGRGGHTNGQIEQNCAINCGIQWNATNKSITKYENLFGVKSIFESIQRFARYRIEVLLLIGRLCT